MAKSLIELVKISGDQMKIWQTESDADLFEKEYSGAQKPDLAFRTILTRIENLSLDSLCSRKTHEYFRLPQNAVQFIPSDNRVIVYADLLVPEFRQAEKLFFHSFIPARIRASPRKDELQFRAKKYGEHNEYRSDGKHIIAGEVINAGEWGVYADMRFGEYRKMRERAAQEIGRIASTFKTENPSFIEHHGGYELFEYWTLDFDDKKRFKLIYEKLANTPTLILTKKIE